MANNNKATSLENVQQYVKGVLQGWIKNKSTLDGFSTGTNDDLLYNGKPIGSGSGTSITVDSALSATSENPVQNKAIYAALQNVSGGGSVISVDDSLSKTSENPVQNKVIANALDGKADVGDIPDISNLALKSEIPDVSGFATKAELNGKQGVLTFDTSPTQNSTNPVTSGGVYEALQNQTGYELPVAATNILGGIKVGSGLAIDDDGVLYVIGSSGQPGFVTLSSESASLDSDNQTLTINILTKSAPVSVKSTNDTLATASIAGDIITITAGTGKGSCEIIVETRQTGIYSSASKTISVAVSNIKIVTWANGTDAEIKAMLDAHYAGDIDIHDYWSVGDRRNSIQISGMNNGVVGESHIAQSKNLILGHAGGRKLSDGVTECAFVVGFDSAMNNTGYMNPTATNSGGWSASKRREWCNTILYNAMPDGIKALIKESVTISNNGTVSTSDTDLMFLLSFHEYWGAESNTYTSEIGGSYLDGLKELIALPGSTSGFATWFRTATNYGSSALTSFRCNAGTYGAVERTANSIQRIHPFFCI